MSVVLVALVAAIVSYSHMRALAVRAGEGWRSILLPLSVDGLLVAASLVLLVRRRSGLPGSALAWMALVLGLAVSLLANVAAAEPTVVGRLVAAWPPIAFGIAYELLLHLVRPVTPDPAPEPAHERQEPALSLVSLHRVERPAPEPEPTPPAEPVVEVGPEPPAEVETPEEPTLVDQVRALVVKGAAEGRDVGRATVLREIPGTTDKQAREALRQVKADLPTLQPV